MRENSIRASYSPVPDEFMVALAAGVSAAVAAAVFVVFHWTIALLFAFLILGLAASANDWFLLAVIFLTPISLPLGSAGSIIKGLPSFSSIDAMQVARWITIAGFFLGVLWRGGLRYGRVLRYPLVRPSLAFAGAVLLSSFMGTPSLRFSSAARAGTHLIVFLGFFFFILVWADSRIRFETLLRVLLFSTLVTAAFGVIQFFAGGYTVLWHFLYAAAPEVPAWTGRASSFFSQVNELDQYLCLFLPFALGCYALTEGRWKRIGRWTFVLGAIALVCTQSHGGLLAFAALLATGALLLVRTWKKRIFAFAVSSSISAAVYAIVQFAGLTHASQLQETSLVGRLLLWSSAWHFFTMSPIYGVGWENFQVLHTYEFSSNSMVSMQMGVQSLYLQLLGETGLLGFVTFFLLLFFAFSAARNALHSSNYPLRRALAFGVVGALVTLLVLGITEAQLEVPQIGTVLWMLFALLVVSERVGSLPASADARRGKFEAYRQRPGFPPNAEVVNP
jgi:O-antigen ligase